MGRFTYDSSVSADFDDRELAHLQAVIVAKIRRGERFTFTWKIDISLGGGRTSVYLYPGVKLAFRYEGGHTPQLNPSWLRMMTDAANSPQGLHVLDEPAGRTPDQLARDADRRNHPVEA